MDLVCASERRPDPIRRRRTRVRQYAKASNTSPTMKMMSTRDSYVAARFDERMARKDSSALARKTSASTASSLSTTERNSPPGPRCPMESTVMQTPTIVANTGSMCVDRLRSASFRSWSAAGFFVVRCSVIAWILSCPGLKAAPSIARRVEIDGLASQASRSR